ncbi:MAG: hypothetical protein WBV94_06170 [Blastocatellia bacterium]
MSGVPDNSILLPLRNKFDEVDFRANRLSEWIELDDYLRKLESRFKDFYDAATKSAGPPLIVNPDIIANLNDLWRRCSEAELIDLQSFVASLEFINRPTWMQTGNGAGIPLNVVGMYIINVSGLYQLINSIEQELNNGNIKNLAEQCSLFRKTLNGLIADRKHVLRKEKQDLCGATRGLVDFKTE